VTGTRRNYVIVLAAAAAVILTIGSLLRPAPDAQRGPDPTPSDLERLAQLSRRRTVEDAARYFTSVADRSAASLVHLDAAGLTGVAWAPGLVITAAPESPISTTLNVTALGRTHAGETGGAGPTLPLLTLRAASLPSLPAARADARMLEAGAWVLAVWRTGDQRAFASGHFVGVRARSSEFLRWDDVTSTVVLTEDMRGGGLFDLDGRLLGVILPADAGLSVIAASSDSPSWPRPCRPLSSRRWRSSRSSGPSARGLPSCTPAKPAWPRSRRPIPFSSHRRPRGGSRDQGPTVSTAFPENRLAIRSSATDPISVHGRSTLIWG
jgi:hypothetical protein